MSHLGERVCDLVDGRLSPDAVEKAHAHLARCRDCRDLVEAERLTKARLTALHGPAPDADFVGRLMAMGGPSGPLPPRDGHVPGSPRPKTVAVGGTRPGGSSRPAGVPVAAAVAVRPFSSGPGRMAGRLRSRAAGRTRLTAAVIGALGAVGAGVAVLATATPVSPATVVPVVDTFVVRQATTVRLPLLDLPAGWQVARRGNETTTRQGGASGR